MHQVYQHLYTFVSEPLTLSLYLRIPFSSPRLKPLGSRIIRKLSTPIRQTNSLPHTSLTKLQSIGRPNGVFLRNSPRRPSFGPHARVLSRVSLITSIPSPLPISPQFFLLSASTIPSKINIFQDRSDGSIDWRWAFGC